FHVTGVQTCALPIWGEVLDGFRGVDDDQMWPVIAVLAGTPGRVPRLGARVAGQPTLRAGAVLVMVQQVPALVRRRHAPPPSGLRSEERRVGKEWSVW